MSRPNTMRCEYTHTTSQNSSRENACEAYLGPRKRFFFFLFGRIPIRFILLTRLLSPSSRPFIYRLRENQELLEERAATNEENVSAVKQRTRAMSPKPGGGETLKKIKVACAVFGRPFFFCRVSLRRGCEKKKKREKNFRPLPPSACHLGTHD